MLLADDDAGVRRALTRLLRSAGLDVESFPSADAPACEAVDGDRPSCVVVDLRMPGLNGLQLQDELARRGLELPILFISGHADVSSSVRAMKGGAVDFLEKPVAEDTLIDAVARALRRHREIQAERRDSAVLQAHYGRLTPREKQVFALVVSGLLNKQVGFELGATEKTIKVHRARVMEKMEAASLADLVRMAGRLGITTTPKPVA